MPISGYSSTPLAKKLGLKPSSNYLLYNHPKYYFSLFDDLPNDIVALDKIRRETADFIHLFFTSEDELITNLPKYILALKKSGMLWISWPKGSSKIPTDIKRDFIREHVLASGLVDIKVAAIDSNWSGLKFVYRLKDRIV